MSNTPKPDKLTLPAAESNGLDNVLLSMLDDLEESSKKRTPYHLSYDKTGDEEDEVHLRDYWRAVRKRLWIVIGLVALVTTFAAFYMSRKPDIYQAQARVQVDIENTNPALGSTSKNNPVIFNNPINYPAYFNTQLKILSGPGLLRRVAKILDLEHNSAFLAAQSSPKDSTWQKLARAVGVGNSSGNKNKDSAPARSLEVPLVSSLSTSSSQADLAETTRLAPYIEALQEDLKVEPVKEDDMTTKETFLIDIRFADPDPQIAAKVVNAIGDIFMLSNLEKKTQFSSTTSDYLQKRIVELQSQIRSGEEQLANYAKSHQILSLDASQNTVVDRLAGLNKQLLEAENDRKLAEAAYRAALAPGAAQALAESSGNDRGKQITEAEDKLIALRQQRAQMLIDYTEKYPEIKQIDEQIAILEKQIKDKRTQATSIVVTNLETRYRETRAREQALSSAFDKQRSETLTQNDAAINYKIIQQEIETNKDLLVGLLQRFKENDVVTAGTPNNISVVDYAPVPYKPIGPRRLTVVVVAFALSLALSIAFALFLEYLDDTIGSVDDVENKLHLPALAVIPTVAALSRRRLLRAGKGLTVQNGKGNGDAALLIGKDARSPLAEAYRQLRTSVLLSTAGRAPKTLLVTSSAPSEGKTTTSINTSICLAQTGAEVLIIDADMRRPRLHSIFNIENAQGLSTILSREMTDAEVHMVVQQDKETGLYLLPSGPIPPNPAELLGSDQMRRLIATLERKFTHIVIDSPPIASFTDGVLISRLVNGVLLVVHSGKSTKELVKHSRRRLNDIGAKIFGVVLNNANLRQEKYYYQYSESYYSASESAG